MAHKISDGFTEKQITGLPELRSMYNLFDRNKNNSLVLVEFERSLNELGFYLDHASKRYFFEHDEATLNFEQFRRKMGEKLYRSDLVNNEGLLKIFQSYDIDNSGTISFEELKQMLSGSKLSVKSINSIIAKIDSDGSGLINFDEFKQIFYD